MKLILVRHGETEANVNNIFSGWSNYELTERGKLQIKQLAKELKNYKIDAIYTSPLKRTIKTAEEIARTINKPIIIDSNLKEINFGIFEQKTAKQIEETYPKQWKDWIKNYEFYTIPEGESLYDVVNRVKTFINCIKNTKGCYVVVSHGGTIQSMITYLLNLNINKMWHFSCAPGGYVEIDYINNFAYLRKLTSTI